MEVVETLLSDVQVLKPFCHRDERGEFVKPFHEGALHSIGIEMEVREEFFSTSALGVIRGMHFQAPPNDHQKIVYAISGTVLDVVLDIRSGSATYGYSCSVKLSDKNRNVIFIPKGFAHGFISLSEGSCLVYKTDAVHEPSSDCGVRWDSFGFDWPNISTEYSLSPRDLLHPPLGAFESPFLDR